ncbi:dipeptidase [Hymenobacter rubripertinctus]|uniref:Dipeptidase n=1 Tax=Hymenobacter rubripertinctus TaxID=2029981 RepID=A0A418QYL0_9BACT|nr:dipeptidase [Hymenobacter rubripertinctus]RIY10247.1 dipeptidase [Hymenobacter rubripertinctus]
MASTYLQNNQDRFLTELIDWLRIPSVSADPKFAGDITKAAEYLKARFEEVGLDNVELCPTAGNPIVYGEKMVDASLPTVLVYGHYDVQPADPYELWDSPPFEPVIKDEKIYARGACDDKGQVYMHVKALEVMQQDGAFPCNIKVMIEGEEEIGSNNLAIFVRENKAKLKADVILISDTGMLANDAPSIEVGLRGLSYHEVEVTGPNRDLHSGLYGGAVANPINVLCKMIASLHDENNHITIPEFYQNVAELTGEERAELNRVPHSDDEFKQSIGLPDVYGEKGYTTVERVGIRPTLDVNGIWGGYTGEGAKTVIASKAYAKISMRLVPNQTSEEITALFQKHFASIAPSGVTVKVKPHHGGEPVVTPTDSVAYKAAADAMETTFGKRPIPTRGGGSIPIVAMFKSELGLDTVLLGFGLDSDAIHSPNEHYGVFNFLKGIETIPHFYRNYAAAMK